VHQLLFRHVPWLRSLVRRSRSHNSNSFVPPSHAAACAVASFQQVAFQSCCAAFCPTLSFTELTVALPLGDQISERIELVAFNWPQYQVSSAVHYWFSLCSAFSCGLLVRVLTPSAVSR
jgi:hypothetical protein